MLTITTRDLKQNPAAAIREVMQGGAPAVVTAHGRPTGVLLVPEGRSQRTWVPGQTLRDAVAPLSGAQAIQWRDDLARARQAPFGRDVWDTES